VAHPPLPITATLVDDNDAAWSWFHEHDTLLGPKKSSSRL